MKFLNYKQKGMMEMETIKTYIDNVFAAYPQTDEVQGLKRDMLANMEEKYVALRQGGKDEHEAAYSVIADFGSMREITAELGLDMNNEEPDNSIFLSLHEAQTYLAESMKNALWIGLGVWLIIAGASSVIAFRNLFILFLTIAIAVAMFIITTAKMKAYESYGRTPIRLDTRSREIINGEHIRFGTRSAVMIAFGVMLIILSVGLFTVIRVPIPFFLNIVGFSVFLFIVAGCYGAAFDVLLRKGEYAV